MVSASIVLEQDMEKPTRPKYHLYTCPECKTMHRSTSLEVTGTMCGVVGYLSGKICPGRIRPMTDRECLEESRRWQRSLEYIT